MTNRVMKHIVRQTDDYVQRLSEVGKDNQQCAQDSNSIFQINTWQVAAELIHCNYPDNITHIITFMKQGTK